MFRNDEPSLTPDNDLSTDPTCPLCDTPWPSSHSPLLLLIYSAAFSTFPSLWTQTEGHQGCTLWLLARAYSAFSLLSNPRGWLCRLRRFRHERVLDSWVSAQNTLVNIHNLKNTKHKLLRCSVDVQNVLDFRFGFLSEKCSAWHLTCIMVCFSLICERHLPFPVGILTLGLLWRRGQISMTRAHFPGYTLRRTAAESLRTCMPVFKDTANSFSVLEALTLLTSTALRVRGLHVLDITRDGLSHLNKHSRFVFPYWLMTLNIFHTFQVKFLFQAFPDRDSLLNSSCFLNMRL